MPCRRPSEIALSHKTFIEKFFYSNAGKKARMHEIAADIGKGPWSLLAGEPSVTLQAEIPPAIVADGAVNVAQEKQAIHRRIIPGGTQAAEGRNPSVQPETVAVDHEEWPVAQKRKGFRDAAARIKNFRLFVGE